MRQTQSMILVYLNCKCAWEDEKKRHWRITKQWALHNFITVPIQLNSPDWALMIQYQLKMQILSSSVWYSGYCVNINANPIAINSVSIRRLIELLANLVFIVEYSIFRASFYWPRNGCLLWAFCILVVEKKYWIENMEIRKFHGKYTVEQWIQFDCSRF